MGSLVPLPLRTEVKKASVDALRTPSAMPVVLLNVTRRPFTPTTYCVGPTAPSQSGGNAFVGFVPDSVARRCRVLTHDTAAVELELVAPEWIGLDRLTRVQPLLGHDVAR